MTDLQIKGKKIALLDSSDNIIYTLPDSSGAVGDALISNGAGALGYGALSIDDVLNAGNTTDRNIEVDVLNVDILNTNSLINLNQHIFQGQTAGFAIGNETPMSLPNNVEKFPFATDANAISLAERLGDGHTGLTGISSSTTAYAIGGVGLQNSPVNRYSIRAHRFPFAVDGSSTPTFMVYSTIWGGRTGMTPHASSTHGYLTGGLRGVPYQPGVPPSVTTTEMYRFPFAEEGTNTSSIGDLTTATHSAGGHSSTTHGYLTGGDTGVPPSIAFGPTGNGPPDQFKIEIQKFPFASSANSANIANLTERRRAIRENSSFTHGYASGGRHINTPGGFPPAAANRSMIDKFPFSTDANSTNVGDLIQNISAGASHTSTTHAYGSGGRVPQPSPFKTNAIEKFPFASEENSTDVGDLPSEKIGHAGFQV